MPGRAADSELAGSSSKRQKLEHQAAAPVPAQEEARNSAKSDPYDAFRAPEALFATEALQTLYSQFNNTGEEQQSKNAANAKVGQVPFPSLQLHNVFASDLVNGARKQLVNEVSFSPKENDLYSYRGSGDLSDDSICTPESPLGKLRDALYSEEFTEFISSVTGVKLFANRPDLSSHQYWDGDHLLAHDDDVRGEMEMDNEGRRIAFILYLVDEKWSKEDGGSLDLFECNSLGHPTTVKQSIYPKFNSIALFEVTPTSYHTVAEVTLPAASTRNPPYRLSISGWFHGPLASRLALPANISTFSPIHSHPAASLINPTYLDKATHENIQKNLIDDSSIELRGFLKPDVWAALSAELASTSFDLSARKAVGPAHLRHFYPLSSSPILDKVIAFFRSSDFLALLTSFTSLEFRPEETKGRVTDRLFKQGCYTLLHDQGNDPDGVDIILGLGTKKLQAAASSSQAQKSSIRKGKGKANGLARQTEEEDEDLAETGWSSKWGGQINYVPAGSGDSPPPARKDEEDEIEDADDGTLTISPRPNTLAIIVRNINTLKYVKYVNNSAKDPVDGTPLARMDIEGLFEVDVGEDEGESVEGELVTDESDEGEEDNGEGEEEQEEWTGFSGKPPQSAEADGEDELEDD